MIDAFRVVGSSNVMGSATPIVEFASYVPVAQRTRLEALLYFNTCQGRVAECIAQAVERFGAPEIVVDGDRLRIRIKDRPDVQTLFALEAPGGRPIGVAIYIRPDVEHISVLHLSIAAEYASGGPKASCHLLLRLLREVRRAARQVKGVRRLELAYVRSASQRSNSLSKAL